MEVSRFVVANGLFSPDGGYVAFWNFLRCQSGL